MKVIPVGASLKEYRSSTVAPSNSAIDCRERLEEVGVDVVAEGTHRIDGALQRLPSMWVVAPRTDLDSAATGGATEIPWAASSSAVPIMAVQSPWLTPTSRPGQATTSPGVG